MALSLTVTTDLQEEIGSLERLTGKEGTEERNEYLLHMIALLTQHG